MIALSQPSRRGAESDLVQVIEPLASYICAANRPRAALASALALLFNQVEETNRTANGHVASFAENHCVCQSAILAWLDDSIRSS